VVDSLFVQLEIESLCTQGYTDGLELLITGTFSCTISELMDRALNILIEQSRCRAKKPSITPDKLELVLLRKR
jgi:hypothetical protein